MTDGSEFESRQEQKLSLICVVEYNYGAHPATYPIYIGLHLSEGIKRPEREVGHDLSACVEFKNKWI
jgi:hypothetical protein